MKDECRFTRRLEDITWNFVQLLFFILREITTSPHLTATLTGLPWLASNNNININCCIFFQGFYMMMKGRKEFPRHTLKNCWTITPVSTCLLPKFLIIQSQIPIRCPKEGTFTLQLRHLVSLDRYSV